MSISEDKQDFRPSKSIRDRIIALQEAGSLPPVADLALPAPGKEPTAEDLAPHGWLIVKTAEYQMVSDGTPGSYNEHAILWPTRTGRWNISRRPRTAAEARAGIEVLEETSAPPAQRSPDAKPLPAPYRGETLDEMRMRGRREGLSGQGGPYRPVGRPQRSERSLTGSSFCVYNRNQNVKPLHEED